MHESTKEVRKLEREIEELKRSLGQATTPRPLNASFGTPFTTSLLAPSPDSPSPLQATEARATFLDERVCITFGLLGQMFAYWRPGLNKHLLGAPLGQTTCPTHWWGGRARFVHKIKASEDATLKGAEEKERKPEGGPRQSR